MHRLTARHQHRRPSRPFLHDAGEVVDMMRARMSQLVAEWGLNGVRDGNEFVALNPLRVDRKLGSFRICLEGHPYAGLVKDFAGGGQTWSPLSFTAALWFNGSNSAAFKWAIAWLGLDGTDPASIEKRRVHIDAARRDRELQAKQNNDAARRTRGYAMRLWTSASERIRDTPVDWYLFGRGIDLRALHFDPGAIRYHPALHCQEVDRDLPAMVTIINNAAGDSIAIHRTYLQVHADGRVTKAALEEPKKTLGRYQGGFISLSKGTTVDPELGVIRKNPPLSRCSEPVWVDVTEGIEDGLSVVTSDHTLRVIAGISVDNMANIAWPPIVAGIVLWRQADAPGSPAEKAVREKVVPAWQRQGKKVKLPAMPDQVKDVNDVLRGKGNESAI